MAIIKKGKDIETRYTGIAPVCKATWRVFKVLAYLAAGAAALLAVMSVVLLFVDVTAEELLFTPYMKVVTENGERMFDVALGNGIEVLREYDAVDVSNIKGALYAGIFTLMAALTVSVPVFVNLGKLFKNIGAGKALAADNAGYVNFIGLSIMVGNPLVLLIKRYFNYALMKNFVDVELRFDFGIDLFGFLLGLLLILFGTVYGYACSLHKQETALILRESSK